MIAKELMEVISTKLEKYQLLQEFFQKEFMVLHYSKEV